MLELMVGRAVAWARTIERAVHDPGPWTFRTDAGVTPALRLVDHHQAEIVFTGLVVPAPNGLVELWSGDELVTVAPADFTKGRKLTWRMSLKEPTPAS